MSAENSRCYNWGGGVVPGGLKPGMLFNLLRFTAWITTKYHLAQMPQVGRLRNRTVDDSLSYFIVNGNSLGIVFKGRL
jgi:hypothetical protein